MKRCSRCKKLEGIILDIHWMARRYADGHKSYAPGRFNLAIDKAISLGLSFEGDRALGTTYYANDGDGVWDSKLRQFIVSIPKA